MAVIKKVVFGLVFLAVLVFFALFVTENSQSVSLNPIIIPAFEHNIALIIIVAFSIGGVFGLLFSSGVFLKLRAQILQLRNKLRVVEKELTKLREPSQAQ